jgi:predicted nucleotidyltransferase component of viral defense system
MLKTQSVSEPLLDVLRGLMEQEAFSGFALGGGTSLALRYAHRKSVDLDLFTSEPFDSEGLLNQIRARFSTVEVFNRTPGSLCLNLDGVKVDFLLHAYPIMEPPDVIDGIRLMAREELAAMKVNAVTNRGSKKDFSDLLLLHQEGLELSKSLNLYCQKYGEAGRFLALRSLQWFEDAENEPDPLYLNEWTWDSVRNECAKLAAELIAG